MSRPREFDYDKVLHQLMLVFWQKGYKGTSLTDLMESSKLKKPSIYGAYGDKHAVFIKALRLYRMQAMESIQQLLSRENSALKTLELWKSNLLDSDSSNCPKGCFIVNMALELGTEDAEAKVEIDALFEDSEKLLEEVIRRGQKNLEITSRYPARIIAQNLATAQHGVRVLEKAGASPDKMKAILDYSIESILADRDA
ncbi:TetR/AcrR family transcriptional regulator [Saccharibacillus sp. CPCC 101409]|uniref:TetR/AcrR family transcriptional regulator n=1 Tax=Saccharibacillus sp. CPCC 101409 TaxID=3058041 RepID=UPI002671C356|nr:TetR/AcrR family transcriptional regulator [Saccharibacillus sp. CPCC 101409]MDO3411544.1 TetR/AcrR family transcriptional regulator [Saccharibacillus sp. CPCC 101409]